MNLYKFHSKPESLDYYGAMDQTNPHIFWEKYKNNTEELKKREKAISKDSRTAQRYAKDVLKRPFPAGEAAIATDTYYAYLYARDVLKGPFPAGEEAISKDAEYALGYAKYVLNGPFPAGEAAIAGDARYASYYANQILKADFYLDGKLIAKA